MLWKQKMYWENSWGNGYYKQHLEELFKATFFDRFATNGLGESGLEQPRTADNCFERIPQAIWMDDNFFKWIAELSLRSGG